MGIFDQIDAALGGEHADIFNKMILWAEEDGDIHVLLDKLKQGGLSEEVQSWLNDEENQLSVSAEQVQKALGEEAIQQLALKIGENSHTACTLLAQYLPQMAQAVMVPQVHKK